jgi:hypothetical protein
MTQRSPHSSAASATPGAEGKRRKQIAIDNVNSPLYNSTRHDPQKEKDALPL